MRCPTCLIKKQKQQQKKPTSKSHRNCTACSRIPQNMIITWMNVSLHFPHPLTFSSSQPAFFFASPLQCFLYHRKSQCCFGTDGSACWAETNTSDKISGKVRTVFLLGISLRALKKHSKKMVRQQAETAYFFSPFASSLSLPPFSPNAFFLLLLLLLSLSTLCLCWKLAGRQRSHVLTWHACCTGVVGISGARPSRHGCTGN